MAVDEALNAQFRDAIDGLEGLSEKKMMGGTCFMLNGHMIGGAHQEKDGRRLFMFRVGVENGDKAGALGGGEEMAMGGRRMRGLYWVDADICDEALFEAWKSLAVTNALSLPPKGV